MFKLLRYFTFFFLPNLQTTVSSSHWPYSSAQKPQGPAGSILGNTALMQLLGQTPSLPWSLSLLSLKYTNSRLMAGGKDIVHEVTTPKV